MYYIPDIYGFFLRAILVQLIYAITLTSFAMFWWHLDLHCTRQCFIGLENIKTLLNAFKALKILMFQQYHFKKNWVLTVNINKNKYIHIFYLSHIMMNNYDLEKKLKWEKQLSSVLTKVFIDSKHVRIADINANEESLDMSSWQLETRICVSMLSGGIEILQHFLIQIFTLVRVNSTKYS